MKKRCDAWDVPLGDLVLPIGWTMERCRLEGRPVHLLVAGAGADPVSIPLRAKGMHEVRLGLYRSEGRLAVIRVKRSDDRFWRTVRPAHLINDPGGQVQDGLLGVFDLRGDELLVAPGEGAVGAGLAYVRLTSATAPKPLVRGHVGAVCDGHGILSGGVTTADDLRSVISPFADSSFSRICWGTTAGSLRALYLSREMEYFGEGQTDFFNAPNENCAHAMRRFVDQGVDPLRVVIEYAHEVGLELWASDRISHTYPLGAYCDNFSNTFHRKHYGERVANRDGTLRNTMSLAYPAFRDFKIRALVEQARYGIDGIYIDFLRFDPVVGFEAPIVDSFQAVYGKNPRNPAMSDTDAEWLAHKASFVTGFLRELRAALAPVERERGARIPIATQVFAVRNYSNGRFADASMHNGLDIQAWAREGLVDIVAPSTTRNYGNHCYDHIRALLSGSDCRLWACLGQHDDALFPTDYHWETYTSKDPDKRVMPIADLDAWRVARAAADAYHQDVEGVFLWEAGDVPSVLSRWEILRRLGDREWLMNLFGPPVGPFDGRLTLQYETPEVEESATERDDHGVSARGVD